MAYVSKFPVRQFQQRAVLPLVIRRELLAPAAETYRPPRVVLSGDIQNHPAQPRSGQAFAAAALQDRIGLAVPRELCLQHLWRDHVTIELADLAQAHYLLQVEIFEDDELQLERERRES